MNKTQCPACYAELPDGLFDFKLPAFMTLGKSFSKAKPCPNCQRNIFGVLDWDSGDVKAVRWTQRGYNG